MVAGSEQTTKSFPKHCGKVKDSLLPNKTIDKKVACRFWLAGKPWHLESRGVILMTDWHHVLKCQYLVAPSSNALQAFSENTVWKAAQR